MVHQTKVKSYPGTLEKLAVEIGDLRYDALAEFLELLAQKIEIDGDKDKSRGRSQLAAQLHRCSTNLQTCKESIDKAWVISEPFM